MRASPEAAAPHPALRGALIIISAPSGTGKSTICQRLLKRHRDLRCSVSCTTRSPRSGEQDGRHYHFITREEFKRRIERHEFLEWAIVHDEYYGTPRAFIDSSLRDGTNVLLAVDVQGASAIRRKRPDSILIFLVPPSLDSLKERLAQRRDESESVARRLESSRQEMEHIVDYDYVVVNDSLVQAVAEIECILVAEGLRVCRRHEPEFVRRSK